MNNTYKFGEYWEHIVDYENRALFPKCRSTETMEHILTECEASGQLEIWKYIELLYEKKGLTFEKPSLGDQLGCAVTKRESKGDKDS